MKATDWADLELCLRIAQAGSVKQAAAQLGVSHSTLLRRLGRFERQLGEPIFLRTASGCTPTPVGHAVLGAAEAMDVHAREVRVQVGRTGGRLSGQLRVALPDLAGRILMPTLARFADAHEDIRLHLMSAQSPTQLAAGEVDVMLTLADKPPVGQMGRRLGQARFAVYRSHNCLPTRKLLIDLPAEYDQAPVGRFLKQVRPAYDRNILVDDLALLLDAIRAGLGDGVLPCAVGDSLAELAKVGDEVMSDPDQSVWLLYRRELRNNPRVSAFVSFLAGELKTARSADHFF